MSAKKIRDRLRAFAAVNEADDKLADDFLAKRPKPNWELIEQRKPPPPASLVGALHDKVAPSSGKLIKSKPIKR